MSSSPAHESAPTSSHDQAVRDAVQASMPRTVADLSRLVRIPSVSWAAFDPAPVLRSAEAVAQLARGTGLFESVEVTRSRIASPEDASDEGEWGQPAVLAIRPPRNNRPTILLYAHHDVQPPGRDDDWSTPPFEPTVIGDRLYGRGAADDKAGVMTHIASLRALTAVDPDPDLGIVLFIEGEEESGSRSFDQFLADNRDSLRADAIIVADSNNWNETTPALTVGLRGNVTFALTIRTLEHASHSGMFGGAVPDAMLATISLLSTLWTADGSVAVPGLREHAADVPEYPEEQLQAEAGLLEGVRSIGEGPILGRIWSKPSITVTGIDAPSVAHASNTLAPSITVKISARVAPGQDAAEAFAAIEKHLRGHAPFGAQLDIDDVDLGDPFLVDTAGSLAQAIQTAMSDAWGVDAVQLGVGGSIPFIPSLVRTFPEAEILVTGVEDPDSRAHSPNESLHLGVFHRAILTETLFMTRLATETSA